MKPAIIIVLALLLFASCGGQKPVTLDDLKQNPERKLATYNGGVQLPVADRLLAAPKAIVDYLDHIDSTDRYKAYTLSAEEKRLFMDYYGLLPATFRQGIEDHVVGIYFIQDFTGGGMADFLFGPDGTMYMAVYLNPRLLHETLSEWISYRDNASFQQDDSVAINVDCGNGYQGLLQALVHEAAHVYDYYHHVTPYIEDMLRVPGEPVLNPFVEGVWLDKYNTISDLKHFKASAFSGYGMRGPIPKSEAVELYTLLSKSPFSSLYGTLSWAEDFAESFTWYYLHKRLGIDYVVSVSVGGVDTVRFTPSGNEQVEKRYALFDTILE